MGADACFSACFLNACLRHADIVDIACFSPIVNTRRAIHVDKDGLTRRTTFYTLLMYTNYLEPLCVPVICDFARLSHGDKQTGKTKTKTIDVPLLAICPIPYIPIGSIKLDFDPKK